MNLFKLLSDYYVNTTDKQIEVNANNIRMFYRDSDNDRKVIVVINAALNSGQTVSDTLLENIRDKSRMLISSNYGGEPAVITIICTDSFDAVKDSVKGCSSGDERWIVDENRMCIMLTEEQTVYDKEEYDLLDGILRAEVYSRRPDEEKFKEEKPVRKKTGGPERRQMFSRIKSVVCTFSFGIVLANFLTFIWLEIIGDTLDAQFMYEHGALYWRSVIDDGEYYRLFTCMFLHFGFDHLVGNMFTFVIIGNIVERVLGRVRFAVIYFGSGLTASAVSLAFHYSIKDNSICAGASGAIYGVMGALLVVFIFGKGLGGIPSTRGLIIYMIVGIGNGILYGTVDNSAHVGGFIGGAMITYLLITGYAEIKRRKKWRY